MAEALTININVTGSAGGESTSGEKKKGVKDKQSRENAKTYWTLDRAKSVAENLASQVVNTGVTHVGFYSGNTVMQEQLQNTMSIGGEALGIGLAFTANPILGGIALVTTAISKIDEFMKYIKTIDRENYMAGQLARRAGYLSNQNR